MTGDLLEHLKDSLEGELYFGDTVSDNAQLLIYSTDASVYREKPLAVAIPKTIDDIKALIVFARKNKQTLIPRAAGTSLAGQVVGNGIIVDISKYFNRIIEVDPVNKWVRVQPGVIRDDLNQYLRPYGLMYGPETSTSNRAMIGGMIGNNSCGLHSIVWGAARDHLLSVNCILSDGTEAVFGEEAETPQVANGRKKEIYDGLYQLLEKENIRALIKQSSPKDSVVRRNSGYALDSLVKMEPFIENGERFNLCKLIAGSEGTLVIVTEARLQLIDLPPKEIALVCVHTNTLQEALIANAVALKHKPMASELVDRYIMDFTKGHPVYQQNRFFIEGEPEAMLMVEFMANEKSVADVLANAFIDDLKILGHGYAYPILDKVDAVKAWDIRKAGLGLLRNLKSEAQPVNLIEDCAVAPEDLPAYIADVQALLAKHNTKAAYYAHAGAGELHVEPIIDLKKKEGVIKFRSILKETAILVRKYNGSLSGEHGDGRLRGEYIVTVAGPELYELFKKVKEIFDPELIFNKGKIVNTPPMDQFLRFQFEPHNNQLKTNYDFSSDGGILKLAEKCSGSGDCRKSHRSAGTMCPSYMVTQQEKDTTRARANILREFLSNVQDTDPMAHDEIKDVMDLCLSCKACKSECPSAVDITKMKAEFLQQYYEKKGFPFRSRMVGNFSRQMKLASSFPKFYNLLFQSVPIRKKLNSLVGFHPDRSIPSLSGTTLHTWFKKRKRNIASKTKKVYFFCDEFTNYYDVEIGKKAICLLEALGYEVLIPIHQESGRTFLSKGMVKKAKEIINRNIETLSAELDQDTAITGVEPSAILTLKDEYIDLAHIRNKQKAQALAEKTFTIEEFIAAEYMKGNILKNQFTGKPKHIVLHGHCYQKALSFQGHSKTMLSLPENYKVEIIPSGCCGMAGSFGYEKEHYEISQRIGELILFPFVRNLDNNTIVAAAGTSCRHQIKDGTNVKALHPVEILWDALLINDNLNS